MLFIMKVLKKEINTSPYENQVLSGLSPLKWWQAWWHWISLVNKFLLKNWLGYSGLVLTWAAGYSSFSLRSPNF